MTGPSCFDLQLRNHFHRASGLPACGRDGGATAGGLSRKESNLAKAGFLGSLVALGAVMLCAQDLSQETKFRVKLLNPLSTETSRKGDKITAQVLSPDSFKGDYLDGTVDQSKSGHKVKGTSVLKFSFQRLHHREQATPIQSSIQSVVNSRGQADVDEEGHVIRKKNNLGKAAAATAAGAAIGAVLGGGKGAAIGAGAGAVASLIFIELAVEAPKVSFAPGSEFLLAVKKR